MTPGSGSTDFDFFVPFGNRVLFATIEQGETILWYYAGKITDPLRIGNVGTGRELVSSHQVSDKVVLQLRTIGNGDEIWVTDGSEAGTQLLVNGIQLVAWYPTTNGLYWQQSVDGSTPELWATDGSRVGTALIHHGKVSDFQESPSGPYFVSADRLYRRSGFDSPMLLLQASDIDIVDVNETHSLIATSDGHTLFSHVSGQPSELSDPEFNRVSHLATSDREFYFYSKEANPSVPPAVAFQGNDEYHFWKFHGNQLVFIGEWSTPELTDWQSIQNETPYDGASWVQDAWMIQDHIVVDVNTLFNDLVDSGFRALISLDTRDVLLPEYFAAAGEEFSMVTLQDPQVSSTYRWDLDSDGVFDDGQGVELAIGWQELLGFAAGRTEIPIRLQIRTSFDDRIASVHLLSRIRIGIPGDATGDGAVTFADFLVLSANFNRDGTDRTTGDFSQDGVTT